MIVDAEKIQNAYLAWARRAAPFGLVLLALIGAEQAASAAGFWGAPGADASVRPIGWTVGAAAIFIGRGLKYRDLTSDADPLAAAAGTSWTLLGMALAPALVGFVLSFMTRFAADFYLLLAVSLVGYGVLFPRLELWRRWIGVGDAFDEGRDPEKGSGHR